MNYNRIFRHKLYIYQAMKQSKYLEDGGAKFKIKQITKVYEARRTNIKPQDYLYKINFSKMNQDLPSKFLLRKNHKTR